MKTLDDFIKYVTVSEDEADALLGALQRLSEDDFEALIQESLKELEDALRGAYKAVKEAVRYKVYLKLPDKEVESVESFSTEDEGEDHFYWSVRAEKDILPYLEEFFGVDFLPMVPDDYAQPTKSDYIWEEIVDGNIETRAIPHRRT